MDDNHKIIQGFLLSALQARLERDCPRPPQDLNDLAYKVAEGLIYLSYLPYALSHRGDDSNSECPCAATDDEIIADVAEEVHTLITDYLNKTGLPNPWNLMNAANSHLYN